VDRSSQEVGVMENSQQILLRNQKASLAAQWLQDFRFFQFAKRLQTAK
jgi:hypothetical protein